MALLILWYVTFTYSVFKETRLSNVLGESEENRFPERLLK